MVSIVYLSKAKWGRGTKLVGRQQATVPHDAMIMRLIRTRTQLYCV
jgi:hypothetical protein